MKSSTALLICSAIAALSACKDKDDSVLATVDIDYSLGVLVTNEGPFSSGTGTITHFDPQTKNVTQNVFENENGYPLGNLVQSMAVIAERGYIVVNNARRIQVVNLTTFKSEGTIESLDQPRYFFGLNPGKGYVTQWGDGSKGELKVIDLISRSVIKTIDIGKGSDRMLRIENYLIVCNAGGYNPATYDPVNDSTVAVIDMTNDSLVARIYAGYNPGGIVQDANGKLWVICYGISDFNNSTNNRPGCLVRINPSLMNVEQTLSFSSHDLGMRLTINTGRDRLYYQYLGKTYEMAVTSSSLPTTPFIDRSFYTIAFNTFDSLLYSTDAGNFSSNGYAIRWNQNGSIVDSFMTGIGPGNFVFLPQ